MTNTDLVVKPPKIVDRPVKKTTFCGAGPADMWPSVHEALTQHLICNMCVEFFNVMDDIRAGIQYLFQTQSKLVLALSGSGHLGMEAVICNLVAPGKTLLIAARGLWDIRAANIASRYGIKTVIKQIPYNDTLTLDQFESMLEEVRPTALFIIHGDSSTGSVQKLEGVGQLCHKYHHTVSTPMMWALRCCLKEIAQETLSKSWERHTAINKYFHKRLAELPVKFHIKTEIRLNSVTTVALPSGYDYMEFVNYMREKHSILIYVGVGPTESKALRIGLMGVNSNIHTADRKVDAMTDTLKALNKSF